VSNTERSDSLAQREVEPLILAGVEREIGRALVPTSLQLPNGSRVDVDGVDEDQSVFVEIFAKQGKLRGAQFHKVARDALKLITITKGKDATRIIAFGDSEAAACVTGKSWLAEALESWDIAVLVVDLDDDVRTGLRAAQARQLMVNSSDD
jgi:hypothetical protein